jgi:ribonuclease HII
MPDFTLEVEGGGVVAGIDEGGRGPLAGPVVAAAVVLDRAALPHGIAGRLDDSKKLTRRVREALAAAIRPFAEIGIGVASVEEIDSLNILGATMAAMRRAAEALPRSPDLALVDGNRAPDLACSVRTVVGGDGRSLSIAAASIVAKTTRDAMMAELAALHPGYGWERNAGYGTAEHRHAIATLGVTPHHRRSFAPVSRYCR